MLQGGHRRESWALVIVSSVEKGWGSDPAKKGSEEKGASEDVLPDVKGAGTVDVCVCEIPEANNRRASGSKCWLCEY